MTEREGFAGEVAPGHRRRLHRIGPETHMQSIFKEQNGRKTHIKIESLHNPHAECK
jgi:hypothetical protein